MSSCADCVHLEANVSLKEANAAKESGQTPGLSVSAALPGTDSQYSLGIFTLHIHWTIPLSFQSAPLL